MAAAFLTNILFWSGIAIGGVVFAALLEVTGAEWSGPLRIGAERFRWFLPVSFVALVLLTWRSHDIYPWAREPLASAWRGRWFVALRVDLTALIVYAAAFAFCRASRRARDEPAARSATASAVTFLIVYAVGFSLIAVDVVMSLEPRWTSTLFPGYFFTGNVFAGIAAVAALAVWNVGTPHTSMPEGRSRDTANLLAGVALFWLYLFWSQFLVIWYGNLTAEVGYLMVRLDARRTLAWVVLALCCVVPSVVFVPKWGKTAVAIKFVAPAVLVGLWLERWMLVAPDLSGSSVLASVAMTAVFAGLFFVTTRR